MVTQADYQQLNAWAANGDGALLQAYLREHSLEGLPETKRAQLLFKAFGSKTPILSTASLLKAGCGLNDIMTSGSTLADTKWNLAHPLLTNSTKYTVANTLWPIIRESGIRLDQVMKRPSSKGQAALYCYLTSRAVQEREGLTILPALTAVARKQKIADASLSGEGHAGYLRFMEWMLAVSATSHNSGIYTLGALMEAMKAWLTTGVDFQAAYEKFSPAFNDHEEKENLDALLSICRMEAKTHLQRLSQPGTKLLADDGAGLLTVCGMGMLPPLANALRHQGRSGELLAAMESDVPQYYRLKYPALTAMLSRSVSTEKSALKEWVCS